MAYADTTELARILKIRTPSDEQEAALDRVLEAAAGEIDSELNLAATTSLTDAWQIALLELVNLERAHELWLLQEVPMGLTGLGNDIGIGPTYLTKNSWEKYAQRLAPLKDQWGLA